MRKNGHSRMTSEGRLGCDCYRVLSVFFTEGIMIVTPFRFSLLQILPKTHTRDEVLRVVMPLCGTLKP